MRRIKYIAVHCTAGSQLATVKELQLEFKRKGWKNPGYHYVIAADGSITQLLDEELISNGVKGYNSVCINVAYMGGLDAKGQAVDNRTPGQKAALLSLLKSLRKKHPEAVIQGHRDFSPDLNRNGKVDANEYIKMCPCFNAKEEYKNL